MAATRDNWKTTPLPTARTSLALEREYSATEFESLKEGFVPEHMEDKWFIFFEDPWLYLHRSWTGYCIYQVRFEPTPAGVRIAEVLVNRDRGQYTSTDAAQDADLLGILLDGQVKRDTRDSMIRHITGQSEDGGNR